MTNDPTDTHEKISLVQTENKKYDVIFHIGAPKTASSAIQKFLLAHRDQLQTLGFYYPEHGLDKNLISGGQSVLGVKLMAGDNKSAQLILETYIQAAKLNNCTLLISAESLYSMAESLAEIKGNYRCKIVAFFRSPLDSIYSNYNQVTKRHYSTHRLETYCLNIINNNDPRLSGEFFETWATLFGQEHLSVLNYDPNVFCNTPIQSIFLQEIGIDKPEQQFKFTDGFINNSYSLEALELKRMLNFILDRDQVHLNDEIDYFLQGYSDLHADQKYQLEDRVSEETYKKLHKKFAETNKKISMCYLKSNNTDFLTSKKRNHKQNISQINLNKSITNLLMQISQDMPNVYAYIEQQLQNALNRERNDYEILKLAEFFNYDINRIKINPIWFNDAQLNHMAKYELVDFYREISQLLFSRGDLKHALSLIEKALELRPNGPAIIALSNRIKAALNPDSKA
jgi:hypothetical protein